MDTVQTTIDLVLARLAIMRQEERTFTTLDEDIHPYNALAIAHEIGVALTEEEARTFHQRWTKEIQKIYSDVAEAQEALDDGKTIRIAMTFSDIDPRLKDLAERLSIEAKKFRCW